LYFGALGSRPYSLGSAPQCGAHGQITEFAGFGTVLGDTWHSSLNDYYWEYGLDDKYDGQKGVSPWPATWNGVLVAFELEALPGGVGNAGVARFTVDWQKHWWKGVDDGSVQISFAPDGLDASLPAYPVVGRWRREYGERLGLFQSGKFYLDWDGDNAWSDADRVVSFDAPGQYPIAADFVPGGGDELGVYVDGQWYIDTNQNYAWDEGPGEDETVSFGDAGSIPIVTRDGWLRDCE
jgi:hypothetical protein